MKNAAMLHRYLEGNELLPRNCGVKSASVTLEVSPEVHLLRVRAYKKMVSTLGVSRYPLGRGLPPPCAYSPWVGVYPRPVHTAPGVGVYPRPVHTAPG